MRYVLEVYKQISDGFIHFLAAYRGALGHRRNSGFRAAREAVENPNDIEAIFVSLFNSERLERGTVTDWLHEPRRLPGYRRGREYRP